ncbi:MAG: helix-turn-helix transcriptional regulator [Lachnospiraceae bacterium]|nr:helix-turn-helix transcriptional regulator [Lachnospiraceae bacterium]
MANKVDSSKKKQIAYRIQTYRMNNSLLQKEVASSLDISLSGLKKIETGQTNVTVPYLMKMHEEYGMSADYALFGETKGVDDILDSVSCLEYKDKLLLFVRLFAYMSEINDDATKSLTKEELINLIENALK